MTPVRNTTPRRPGAAGTTGRGNSDFTALAQRIQSLGLMRRRYGYYWTKLIGLPLAVVATIVAFILIGDTWWQLITAVVFGILFAQVAFLGHDAAHRQIFASGKANDWASLVIGNLFVGMSYGWWRHKHTRHHANPNKQGADPDIELPVIAVTPDRVERVRNPLLKWVMSHQGWFFFPILPLEGLSLHASSVRRVLARDRVERRWAEIVFLGVRLIGFVVLAFLMLSPGLAFAFLGVQLGSSGSTWASCSPRTTRAWRWCRTRRSSTSCIARCSRAGTCAAAGCWTSPWAGSTSRSSTTCSLDAAPAPATGVADRGRVLPRARRAVHVGQPVALLRGGRPLHQSRGARRARPVRGPARRAAPHAVSRKD
ncbi:hypothetical protein GCM10009746_16880 [Microbacterium paludicola]